MKTRNQIRKEQGVAPVPTMTVLEEDRKFLKRARETLRPAAPAEMDLVLPEIVLRIRYHLVDRSSDVPIENQENRNHGPNNQISRRSWNDHFCTLLEALFCALSTSVLSLKNVYKIEQLNRGFGQRF